MRRPRDWTVGALGGKRMAIARKIDPAALARAFADEISVVPEVKRVWYRFRASQVDPERMNLGFDIQLASESKAADAAIVDALTRLQTEYFEELNVGALQFTIDENDVVTLDDMVSPDLVEVPREV
jgi:hypothetical protein